MRSQFAKSCFKIVDQDKRAKVILGDIGVHGFRNLFQNYPNQIINMGIMEQAMLGIASGMSSVGLIPIIHTIAPFLIERGLEQIKVDFAYQGLAGNLVSVGASFDYAGLGCTHHCPADVNIMLNVPNMNIYVPGSQEEFDQQFSLNWDNNSLNYFRLSERENCAKFFPKFCAGMKLRSGKQAIAVAVGPLLDQVLDGTQGLDVEVHYVNSFSFSRKLELSTSLVNVPIFLIEPFYSGALLQSLLPSVISRNLSPHQLGVPVEFLRIYGNYESMLRKVALDSSSIRQKISAVIK